MGGALSSTLPKSPAQMLMSELLISPKQLDVSCSMAVSPTRAINTNVGFASFTPRGKGFSQSLEIVGFIVQSVYTVAMISSKILVGFERANICARSVNVAFSSCLLI